eukprot:6285217-Prorocentrum_lima.AAC.1
MGGTTQGETRCATGNSQNNRPYSKSGTVEKNLLESKLSGCSLTVAVISSMNLLSKGATKGEYA